MYYISHVHFFNFRVIKKLNTLTTVQFCMGKTEKLKLLQGS